VRREAARPVEFPSFPDRFDGAETLYKEDPRESAMTRHLLPLVLAVAALPAAAADWPQFHGPHRDNRSPDTGLLKAWPEGGPARLWEASGIGEGYSTVAIVGGRIYTTGEIGGDCVITALDPDGKTIWTRKNGRAWKRSYPGTRSTPTIVDGLLYHLGGNGNLICLRAEGGDVVWSANILKQFDGRNIIWGLAESPLVDGDRVICTPGGENVSMVALDRRTGKVAWTCAGAEDKPGYASPIRVDHGGLNQIVTVMSASVVGVRASDGKLLWRHPHRVYMEENITTPLFHDGFLIVSGCVRKGTTCLQLQVSGGACTVRSHWHNRELDNKQGGLVLLDGRLYGYAESQRRRGPWMCLDFESGRTLYQGAPVTSSYKYPNGCLTVADGMLYLYSDDGRMVLVKPAETGFEVAGRLAIRNPGKRPTWAHPVVFGGRLYVRYGDRLGVYRVSAARDVD
jgi:outer membrane protein assembly factor BamB